MRQRVAAYIKAQDPTFEIQRINNRTIDIKLPGENRWATFCFDFSKDFSWHCKRYDQFLKFIRKAS